VRFLKANLGQEILLSVECDLQIYALCYSDWAGFPLTRKSLTGWFILLDNSPIPWKTKNQHTVSRSFAEAKYRSMATTICELKWLKELLSCFGINHHSPIKLYCDNQSAFYIAVNPVFHEHTKHIKVDSHFVRDELLRGTIATGPVPSHA